MVVASVTTSWAADEVEEVGDLEDPDAAGAVMDVVGDSIEGRQVQSARVWCRSVGCAGTRACIHTRAVLRAFGYAFQPEVGAQQAVADSLDDMQ